MQREISNRQTFGIQKHSSPPPAIFPTPNIRVAFACTRVAVMSTGQIASGLPVCVLSSCNLLQYSGPQI